jgi:hypothetical protein
MCCDVIPCSGDILAGVGTSEEWMEGREGDWTDESMDGWQDG